MKLIISAYPCMGKSTLANQFSNKYYDLESSDYNKNYPKWYELYIKDAIDKLKEYEICFISCHPQVLDELERQYNSNKFDYCIFYPIIDKYEYIAKLQQRYNNTGLEKDKKALSNAILNYDNNIKHLSNRDKSIGSTLGFIDLKLIEKENL